MARICIRGISKVFPDSQGGRAQVLENLSLEIESGEFLTVLGPSGCGKTTLIRIIAGLEPQSAGSIEIDGKAVDGLRPSERNVAMVFQSYALYPHMSVAENLALPLKMQRTNRAQRLPWLGRLAPGFRTVRASIERDVADVAQALGLTPLLDRKPGRLSGGQRQRVALARAIVRRPAAFLMDEPLSNLDANMRAQLRGEILQLHGRLGATFIYVTHDQAEAMAMSSRIVVMFGGRMQQVGRPRDIYEDPDTLAVAAFVGEPRINQLAGVVRQDGAVQVQGTVFPAPLRLAAGAAVTVAIRPEDLSSASTADPTALSAIVTRIEYLGRSTLIHAQLKSGAPVVANVAATGMNPRIGECIGLRPHGRVLFFDERGNRLRFAHSSVHQRVCV